MARDMARGSFWPVVAFEGAAMTHHDITDTDPTSRLQRENDHHTLTDRELLDAQIRALLTNGHTLAQQIAELTIAQQEAAQFKATTDVRLRHVEINLQANTKITTEVRDLLTAFKGGFKVLGWLGTGLKWLGAIAGACTAIYVGGYMLLHGGQTPGGK